MLNWIIDFPATCKVDRIIHKKTIYERSQASRRIQQLFVKEVKQIRWAFKLSPLTVKIPETEFVKEIQVFEIDLKKRDISSDVLVAIDKSIPSPIVFQVIFADKLKYIMSYKRPNLSDKRKWIMSIHFYSDWVNNTSDHKNLPIATSMESLYFNLLNYLLPVDPNDQETLEESVRRSELLILRQNERVRLIKRLNKEKQFNRKVEINSELHRLENEILELSN